MKNLKFYRNIPLIDNTKLFFFQKFGKRIWLELPFIAIQFNLK